ncbi:hypothetical protein B0T19DRAFT_356728 [Cercophora scortea]|uniref:NAD-dependent epimerase/dehydratase domain-containing protein n=1 Tax=Cercophora scortea TaxID=314031 RepID=A0AAE0IKQ7_9PEZI|nr:hypothetical protein B0T19DRAFT_356728 [Cercophora scortea]
MTEKLTITNPTIPPDSVILVTGTNGLIASHVADQLLAAGYRVRGTVRNTAKSSYLEPLFTSRHGPGRFELAEVPDITAPGAWDGAIRGVSGIAHVVGTVDLSVLDPDQTLAEELPWQIALLEAARREPSVKSFVFTSSAWAVWTPDAGKKVALTEWTWNEEAVALARDKSVEPREKGMAGFMALKTLVEREVWDWVRREKPAYTFNSVLLDTVMGECLDPKHQGIPSTAGMVHWVWENKHIGVLNMMQPQWHIDCRDAGRLYVAILASSPRVDKERIFAFGERYSWFKVAGILSELYPEHKGMGAPKNTGWDQTEVSNERGEKLLARLGQSQGWTCLRESLKKNAKSWLSLERAGVTDEKYSVLTAN